jgi:DNA-binding response OmpR family regulator
MAPPRDLPRCSSVVVGSTSLPKPVRVAIHRVSQVRKISDPRYLSRLRNERPLVLLCGHPQSRTAWYRATKSSLPESAIVALLAMRRIEETMPLAFRLGADDVIHARMDERELLGRLRAALQAAPDRQPPADRSPRGFAISPVMECRRAEINLYDYLRKNSHRIVTQEELIDRVFGGIHAQDTSLVRVHVCRLRKALNPSGEVIKTVAGLGYCYSPS